MQRTGIVTIAVLGVGWLVAVSAAAAEDPAVERLNASPRHHEWVEIERDGRTVHAFVVYPQMSEKVPAVILAQ